MKDRKHMTVAERIADLTARGLSFSAAMLSKPAPDDVVAVRRASCDSCPAREVDATGEYCGECGCAKTRLSELSSKIRRGYVRCPRRRPGFSNQETPQ